MNVYDYWRTQNRRRFMAEYGIRVVEAPEVEPISIEEARDHLRIIPFGSPEGHPDDGILEGLYIPAAREWCEHYSGLVLAEQTLELALDGFPSRASLFRLPVGPVHSVESIVYLDADGVETTMTVTDEYLTRLYNGRATVYLPPDVAWPTTLSYTYGERAVFVRYVAGYTTQSPDTYPLPATAKAAILLVLGHLYENRENTADQQFLEIPLGAQALLDKDRRRAGFA